MSTSSASGRGRDPFVPVGRECLSCPRVFLHHRIRDGDMDAVVVVGVMMRFAASQPTHRHRHRHSPRSASAAARRRSGPPRRCPASIDRPDRTSCSSSLSRSKSSSKLFIVVCGGIEGRLRYGRDGVSLAAGRGGGRIRSSTGTGFLVGLCAGCLFKKRPARPPQSNHMYPPWNIDCLLYTSPSPRDLSTSRMPSSA